MKDFDKVFEDMDKVFEEMDKVIQHMDTTFKAVSRRAEQKLPWTPWFAWYPVKIRGGKVWLRTVYRRPINTYVDFDDWTRYEYGTVFDVIRGDE